MRLPVLMLCAAALLSAAAPPAAHADPICVGVGWADPVTGPRPTDGPCAGDVPETSCETHGATITDLSTSVEVRVCAPKPARG